MNEKKAVFIALLFHIVLFLIPSWNQIQEKTIEVFNRADLESSKPVVQSSQATEQLKSDKKADFAGEFDQQVEKQTQSPLKGVFEEGKLSKQFDTGVELEKGEVKGEVEENPTGNILSLGKNPYALSKDIPFGNETVLNTEKVKYASFLNRIADEIYHPWVELAEGALANLKRRSQKLEPNLYITRLKITMDTSGEIKGIQLIQSSGIRELDEAPKKAFWEVEPFPHPPNQLIEEDGFVRLTYEFQFEFRSSFFNIIPWRI